MGLGRKTYQTGENDKAIPHHRTLPALGGFFGASIGRRSYATPGDYFFLPSPRAGGFDPAEKGELGVAAGFVLSCFGFFFSRVLRFWPVAMICVPLRAMTTHSSR